MNRQKIAVIDLDGTLSTYNKWVNDEHFGFPIKYAKDALMELREWGWYIVIFTTRGRIDLVKDWLNLYNIPYNAVNSFEHNPPGTSFKPIADVYFDDRDAHCVGKKPYNWVKVMKRIRKIYQPRPLTTEIDDASTWSNWFKRLWDDFIEFDSTCP